MIKTTYPKNYLVHHKGKKVKQLICMYTLQLNPPFSEIVKEGFKLPIGIMKLDFERNMDFSSKT